MDFVSEVTIMNPNFKLNTDIIFTGYNKYRTRRRRGFNSRA